MPETKLKICVIHGPNLNLLGTREPEVYGKLTLPEINEHLQLLAGKQNVTVSFFQSNHEGAIVDFIQENSLCDGFVINPAAYTHTSIAMRDAFLAINKPLVEVHLSNTKAREEFRQHSYLTDIAIEVFMGQGINSYELGLEKLISYLRSK